MTGSLRIGFAGLGRMGERMAANLVKAGFDVCVWNRTVSKANVFAEVNGCRSAANPAQLAEQSDIVLSMLADDAAVEQVYFGSAGFLTAKSGAAIFAEMGTISVSKVKAIAQAMETAGRSFVDAPVSGATKAAEDAQLLIMAGAEATTPVTEQLGPVLACLGKRTIWLGAVGAGATMKLSVNLLIHGMNQTLSEALALTDGAGIPTALAYEVIENSAVAAPVISYRKGLYLDEAAHDVSFTVALARKDVGLALELAEGLSVRMPQAALNRNVLKAAGDAGYDARDMASLYDFVKRGLA